MQSGLDRFIETITTYASQVSPDRRGSARFVARLGEECAFIRLRDLRHPIRFFRQMAGHPPLRFGVDGFDPSVVDDANPVRHYVAFVVVGYWLPGFLALPVLYLWEILGFVRYRGRWSPGDMRSGRIGVRHGRAVRRHGPQVLPDLVRRDLGAGPAT